ncbi:MAG: solute carrier family 23 protein [Candidatus Izemoplasmatales bacterium]|nr:solute carrier family 23 protein [Candidatus Izemoplasmatales bacterium]
MNQQLRLDVHEKPKNVLAWIFMSLQHVFAMFGATVLVPILTGLPVGVTLVASGIGTLIYIVFTKAKSPVFLGSSFAFILAIKAVTITNLDGSKDFSAAYFGLMAVGIIYVVVGIIIKFVGSNWIKRLLPPVVVGPMIMIIGLVLAPVAISNAGLDGASGFEAPIIALITFVTVVIISIYAKGILKIIPFLIAIVVGYISSVLLNVVSLHNVFDGVSFFSLPDFTFVGTYKMNLSAVLMFSPIAFVTIAEHIGNHTVLGQIIGRDLVKDPGLDNTLLGDGIATFVSAAIGGPANTTYGENTGVVAMTKVASVWVTGLAAIIAIILGFFGYIQAFILSIPNGVLGGMTIVLYGLIAANGVKVLVEEKVNLSNMKNLIIVGAMLVIGLGGAAIQLNSSVSLSGMSLAALVGILLTVILNPQKEQTEDINTIKI